MGRAWGLAELSWSLVPGPRIQLFFFRRRTVEISPLQYQPSKKSLTTRRRIPERSQKHPIFDQFRPPTLYMVRASRPSPEIDLKYLWRSLRSDPSKLGPPERKPRAPGNAYSDQKGNPFEGGILPLGGTPFPEIHQQIDY